MNLNVDGDVDVDVVGGYGCEYMWAACRDMHVHVHVPASCAVATFVCVSSINIQLKYSKIVEKRKPQKILSHRD